MLITISDKPRAPRDLRVKGFTEDSVTLSWVKPKDDGGCPISEYIVEKRESLRMIWHPVCQTEDLECEAKRLTEGASYVFRVSAQNSVGVGPAEELTKSVAAKSPHGTYKLNS